MILDRHCLTGQKIIPGIFGCFDEVALEDLLISFESFFRSKLKIIGIRKLRISDTADAFINFGQTLSHLKFI